MPYLGDRPRLVQAQVALTEANSQKWDLDRGVVDGQRVRWWRMPELWWRSMGAEVRADRCMDELTAEDWDAVAVEEIRDVADSYWDRNGLRGNPFHPRARVHVDDVVDEVAKLPEYELRVPARRLGDRLTPERARALYLGEIDRLQKVVADPVMLTQDRPSTRRRGEPGMRELVVQHQASGLRAVFYYGGPKNTEVGWVVSKTYSIDSIDPDRVETDDSRGSSWRTYVGLGIGTKIYTHAAQMLPHVRWDDRSVSESGEAIRRKLHGLDPWRWHLKSCGCSPEWESLTRDGAPACP